VPQKAVITEKELNSVIMTLSDMTISDLTYGADANLLDANSAVPPQIVIQGQKKKSMR
jgi:hypothetical protein